MKKQLLALFIGCTIVISGFSQKTKTTNFKPYPFEKAKGNENNTKSAQTLLLKKIVSPFDSIVFNYNFDEQRQRYYSVGEVYTDVDFPEFNFKTDFIYDSNMNMIKANTFSWINNQWFYSCYEEFEYDSLGRKTIRVNANNLGTGFVIGGRGYYTYNEQGQLVEYLQKIHNGNDVYEDLNKVVYVYDNNKLVRTIDYYNSFCQWVEPYYGDYIYDSITNLRLRLENSGFYEDVNMIEFETKYEWTRSSSNKVAQRDYYRAVSSNTWATRTSDKYEFLYDETTDRYPIYPTVTDYKAPWEEWFVAEVMGNPNVLTKHSWWTENNDTGRLDYILDAEYQYEQVTIGLNDVKGNDINISVFPNPTKDKINIECSTPLSNAFVKVYNSLGKEVMSKKLNGSEVNLSSLSQGLYLVNIISNGKIVKQEKIVKN
ncbi:MAG TPA: hypothetical protein DD434_08145 [Bacteroidales bacterium]|nr:hypothetical protein [Bacteroidales bacterium]